MKRANDKNRQVNYAGLPASCQNLLNFGLQMPEISLSIHPLKVSEFSSFTERSPNSTKHCHVFESGPYLKIRVKNIVFPFPKNWGTKAAYF